MFDSRLQSRRNLILAFFLLGLVLSSTGNALAAPGGQEPAPGSPKFEAYLTREVRQQLVLLPFYSVFDNLQFKIDGAKVTLLGQTVRPSLKNDAASAVKRIEGVEAVDNKIEVLPPSSADDRIRRAEYRAIYSFPNLQKYSLQAVPPIHIIVSAGRVTLEGSVATEADKSAAGIRANSVSGVFSVTNNLRASTTEGNRGR
jgi:hyperosmotically inducible protein